MSNYTPPPPSTVSLLLTSIGVLACTVCAFFGLMYTFDSNYFIAGSIALFIGVLLFFLPNYMRNHKVKKTKKRDLTPEMSIAAIYGVVSLVAFVFAFHFFYVDFDNRENLRNEGLSAISDLRDIQEGYAREVDKVGNLLKDSIDIKASLYLSTSRNSYEEKTRYKEEILSLLDGNSEEALGFTAYEASNFNTAAQASFSEAVNNATESRVEDEQAKFSIANEWNTISAELTERESIFKNWNRVKVASAYTSLPELYTGLEGAIKEKMPRFSVSSFQINELYIDSVGNSFGNASGGTWIKSFLILIAAAMGLSVYFASPRYQFDGIKQRDDVDLDDDVDGEVKLNF